MHVCPHVFVYVCRQVGGWVPSVVHAAISCFGTTAPLRMRLVPSDLTTYFRLVAGLLHRLEAADCAPPEGERNTVHKVSP